MMNVSATAAGSTASYVIHCITKDRLTHPRNMNDVAYGLTRTVRDRLMLMTINCTDVIKVGK